MKILLISIILIQSISSYAKPYYLIIHGTWCRPFSWHMPGGDFYDALVQSTDQTSVSFFIWSGSHTHAARLKAAQQLVDYIDLSVPKDRELNLITHSHGSNVAILASHIMAQRANNHYCIHHCYALGTPINPTYYFPNMTVIKYFYNIFSFNDFIQPVFGMFAREFPPHERIANIVVTLNGKEPTHTDLHSPLIARWLPFIPQKLQEYNLGNFDQFRYEQPGIIHVSSDKVPVYEIDANRKYRQEQDIMILRYFNQVLRSSFSPNDLKRHLQIYTHPFLQKLWQAQRLRSLQCENQSDHVQAPTLQIEE